MQSINALFEQVKNRPAAAIAVAVAQDEHVLDAVHASIEMGLARFILVGDKDAIAEKASLVGLNLEAVEIIHETDNTAACRIAVKLVSDGKAEALMKGLIDTSVIMKAVLDKEVGLRTENRLSHIGVFELPHYHKLVFVTDAAINIAPDLRTKREILHNAINAVVRMGIAEPKVALLAAKEKVDRNMPCTEDCHGLVEMWLDGIIAYGNGIIAGPMALDIALSKEAAQTKGYESPVAGDADILFVPDIEAGNILYKSFTIAARARSGGAVLGARKPIILTSRSDSADSKVVSVALALLFA